MSYLQPDPQLASILHRVEALADDMAQQRARIVAMRSELDGFWVTLGARDEAGEVTWEFRGRRPRAQRRSA